MPQIPPEFLLAPEHPDWGKGHSISLSKQGRDRLNREAFHCANEEMMLRILSKVGEIEVQNMRDMMGEMVEHFGSPEAVCEAIKDGTIGFEAVKLN